jgi:2OG-Fe(II) oxygenase superfamily
VKLESDPFPHLVEHGLWDVELLRAARDEFDLVPSAMWQRFRNDSEFKDACTFDVARGYGSEACWRIRETFADDVFIERLAHITGIHGLEYDGLGGGLHRIPVGGYLGVHVDFNRDYMARYRRVNVLLYLNDGWDNRRDGGYLVLLSMDPQGSLLDSRVVAPEMNTQVTFVCSERSWHGHPVPAQRERRSLAAYYFTIYPPDDYREPHDTIFAPR